MPDNVNENEILLELQDFCSVADLDEYLMNRMKDMCRMHNKSAGDLVSSWLAFVTTNGLESVLTLENLNRMEREVFGKKVSKVFRASKVTSSLVPPVYNAETIDMSDGMLIDGYETPERKTANRRVYESPKSGLESPGSIFSPKSYSQSSAKYSSRSGKGSVLCSLCTEKEIDWSKSNNAEVKVRPHDEKQKVLLKPYQYMFEKLRDRCGVLNDTIEDMAEIFQEKHHLEEYGHVRIPHPEEVNVIGRVCCDGNGKLNNTSVLLEGSQESSSGQTVPVDLSQLPQFALFPGQIVAAKALNTLGSKLVLKTIFDERTQEFSPEAPNFGPNHLDVVVAAGPFTNSDSLSYEPLGDLVTYIKEHNPSICILIGPFVDCKHELVENGNLNETYEELFQNQMTSLLQSLSTVSTKLVMVPSLRDAHHHVIYPTPPFHIKNQPKDPIYCAMDPCLLNINGLVIGITSVDILFHLGKEEISFPPGLSDRLGRLSNHLLMQRSFYPLYPPSESVNIDFENFETYGKLSVTPHILITPSDLRCFIKDINGSCCINPERLAKGLVGGTFARIRIDSCSKELYKGPMIDYIKAEVVRI